MIHETFTGLLALTAFILLIFTIYDNNKNGPHDKPPFRDFPDATPY